MAMIEDLRLWIGKEVLDVQGTKAGTLVDVYFDVESDHPLFLVVDLGRKHPTVLVPAWNATTSPDHVTVAYEPQALEEAPTVDLRTGVDTEDEPNVFSYYRVDYEPSKTGSGRRLMRR